MSVLNKLCKERFDEMGNYDIPAVINYVLAKTGRSTMSYVGEQSLHFNLHIFPRQFILLFITIIKATQWAARCFSFACLCTPS